MLQMLTTVRPSILSTATVSDTAFLWPGLACSSHLAHIWSL